MKRLVIALCMVLVASLASAEERSSSLVKQFKETHVCPSTGKMATKGVASSYACPGYVVDHGIPFCAGQYLGRSMDQMYNLTYQKYDADNSKKKDVDEELLCLTLKKYVKPVAVVK